MDRVFRVTAHVQKHISTKEELERLLQALEKLEAVPSITEVTNGNEIEASVKSARKALKGS